MMSKDDIWYGFLQAGAQSSPVVRDATLATNSRKTVWLYNHVRDRFLEYSLEVVEPKLRELDDGDISLKALDKAYRAARKKFAPRKAKPCLRETPAEPTAEPETPEALSDFATGIYLVDEEA
jgi:hypothetical protein